MNSAISSSTHTIHSSQSSNTSSNAHQVSTPENTADTSTKRAKESFTHAHDQAPDYANKSLTAKRRVSSPNDDPEPEAITVMHRGQELTITKPAPITQSTGTPGSRTNEEIQAYINNIRRTFEYGSALIETFKFEEGEAYIKKTLAFYKQYPDVSANKIIEILNTLAVSRKRQQDFKTALEYLDEALSYKSGDINTLTNKAYFLQDMGHLQEAIELYENSLKKNTFTKETSIECTLANLAICYYFIKQNKKANDALKNWTPLRQKSAVLSALIFID